MYTLPHRDHNGLDPNGDSISKAFNLRRKALLPLRSEFIAPLLELLVAISGALVVEDYAALCPVLWRKCMDSTNNKVITLVRYPIFFLVYVSERLLGLVPLDARRGEGTRRNCEDNYRGFVSLRCKSTDTSCHPPECSFKPKIPTPVA